MQVRIENLTNEQREIHFTHNPSIFSDIEMVMVLTGRTSLNQKNISPHFDIRPIDNEDTIKRLIKGIKIARKISALRANKKVEDLTPGECTIPIFYNGTAIQNAELKNELLNPVLILPQYRYPKHLFIIRSIEEDNTRGQVISLINFLSKEKNFSCNNLAIISSAYHLPRIEKLFGLSSPQITNKEGDCNSLGGILIFLHGIDRKYQRNGIDDDLCGERERLMSYSSGENPSIAKLKSKNTFYNDEQIIFIKSFNLQLLAKNFVKSNTKSSIKSSHLFFNKKNHVYTQSKQEKFGFQKGFLLGKRF
ncbi:MAG: hypothetical protein A3F11_10490 [Gammaproteobacteria bacterium RIFCSPHIGHO2_12_FULL_37_14]|nr:MAG: hypothetical protein A3F11_10490 [Gammaproteobacteria bacterium RIFCSPHIGHO2_12_FULL_37_14]